jgi:hypothetical protein
MKMKEKDLIFGVYLDQETKDISYYVRPGINKEDLKFFMTILDRMEKENKKRIKGFITK